MYGDVLYYATFFFNESVYGAVYCRPESFYFWAYFVMMNSFWIVIPGCIIVQSTIETAKASTASGGCIRFPRVPAWEQTTHYPSPRPFSSRAQ